MTTPDDLAQRITRAATGRVKHNAASAVTDALAALNYTFVPPGTPGRYAESDEIKHAMVMYLVKQTGLPRETVKDVLAGIEQSGLRPREPDQHPSGLRTTEPAFANVQPFGARHTAAQKPIDQRPPGGKNYA
ncbi:MAG TPA: hypothetical protein VKY22_29400 [Bradyrhizobium sp.]|nr:hypothetical protein [Bradyrhizobium sp.]